MKRENLSKVGVIESDVAWACFEEIFRKTRGKQFSNGNSFDTTLNRPPSSFTKKTNSLPTFPFLFSRQSTVVALIHPNEAGVLQIYKADITLDDRKQANFLTNNPDNRRRLLFEAERTVIYYQFAADDAT